MKALAALTIFWGSCLLFLIQPMIGNILLPVFGGTAGVWIVCLCAFQTLLVAGYVYAHYLGEFVRLGSALQWVHILVLLGAASVLLLCRDLPATLAAVAVLYTAVGANASLVQRLAARDRTSYRFYAVSNLGSFAGLVAFPFVIEALMPTSVQLRGYSAGILVYAVLLALLMAAARKGADGSPQRVSGIVRGLGRRDALPWFLLSAASCFVLDGLTSHLCSDVVQLPLLWCALLAVYLLTWSLAFSETGSRLGRFAAPLILVCLVLQCLHFDASGGVDYIFELVVGIALVFFGCWYLHAHLYARRPDVDRLTGYYFIIALGGAAGGVLASLAVPLAFDFIAEYPLSQIVLLAFVLNYGLAAFRSLKGVSGDASSSAAFVRSGKMTVLVGIVLALAAMFVWRGSQNVHGRLLAQARNFYGTTRVVYELASGQRNVRSDDHLACVTMENNGTLHGLQIANGDWRKYVPTTYYSEVGGGTGILQHPAYKAGRPMRVGLLGMGIGTLAYYGRAGDAYRFFEINPNVVTFATNETYFTFVPKSLAKVEIKVGDARKLLEDEAAASEPPYDLLVVDVFSGDAVPPHLATTEAMRLYLDRLAPGGVIAMHLTNWHLSLLPAVKALATAAGLHIRAVFSSSSLDQTDALWAYVSRTPVELDLQPLVQKEVDMESVETCAALTDDHHSLISHISFNPFSEFRYRDAERIAQ